MPVKRSLTSSSFINPLIVAGSPVSIKYECLPTNAGRARPQLGIVPVPQAEPWHPTDQPKLACGTCRFNAHACKREIKNLKGAAAHEPNLDARRVAPVPITSESR